MEKDKFEKYVKNWETIYLSKRTIQVLFFGGFIVYIVGEYLGYSIVKLIGVIGFIYSLKSYYQLIGYSDGIEEGYDDGRNEAIKSMSSDCNIFDKKTGKHLNKFSK